MRFKIIPQFFNEPDYFYRLYYYKLIRIFSAEKYFTALIAF